MDNIIIKVISISLVIGMIALFGFKVMQNSHETIVSAAENSGFADKINKENLIINEEVDTVKGGDVVAAVRYYSDRPEIAVYVTVGSTTKTYTTTLYKPADFSISELSFYEAVFEYSRSADKSKIYFKMK